MDSPRPAESERDDDLDLLTVPEVLRILKISRWIFYRLVNSGKLPSINLGTRRRVRRSALREFLRRAEQDPTETGVAR
jgi:excisionase family DNA binding protein